MSDAATLLPEFDQEMATTRRVLERVPDEKLDWRPHERSNTIGWNASHLAEIPGWVENTLQEPFFDAHPPGEPPYRTEILASRDEVLRTFDANVSVARKALAAVTDEKLAEMWAFREQGRTIFEMTRGETFRTFIISHMIHHRAILTVSFRLNDIPVPAVYGPSGDES